MRRLLGLWLLAARRALFPLSPRFYRATYPELGLDSDAAARREWRTTGWKTTRVPSVVALRCEAFARMKWGRTDPGVIATRLPHLSDTGYATLGKLAIGQMRGHFPDVDDTQIVLPSTYVRAMSVAAKRAVGLHLSGVYDAITARLSPWERALAKYPIDVFVRETYRYFSGALPTARSFFLDVTNIEYGYVSRSAYLGMHLFHGPFTIDDLPSDLSPRDAVLARQRVESERLEEPAVPAEYIDQIGTRVMSRAEWRERAARVTGAPVGPMTRNLRMAASPSPGPEPRGNSSTTRTKPRVAVLGSLFHSDKHLDRWLENIDRQSIFADIEVAVISVQPSDFERDRLEAFASSRANVILEFHDAPLGIYEAWNRGIELTTAEYLTNMNVDDLRRHDSLERQAEVLDTHAWVDVLCPAIYITLDGSLTWQQIEAIGARMLPSHTTLPGLMSGIIPAQNGPMWRRRLHEDVGLFNGHLESAGDYEFWVRCARAGRTFLGDDEAHVAYFINPEGMSTKRGSRGADEAHQVRLDHEGILGNLILPTYAQSATEAPRGRALAERITAGVIALLTRRPSPEQSGEVSNEPTVILWDVQPEFQTESGTHFGDAFVSAIDLATTSEFPQITVLTLDRPGVENADAATGVRFPAKEDRDFLPAAEREALTHVCTAQGADVFVSTGTTFALAIPTVMLLDDRMVREFDEHKKSDREMLETELALHAAQVIVVASEEAKEQLMSTFAGLEPAAIVVASGDAPSRARTVLSVMSTVAASSRTSQADNARRMVLADYNRTVLPFQI